MKINTLQPYRIFLCLLVGLLFNLNTSHACVDTHPPQPWTTAKIDSTYTYIEVVVHQLQLYAGSTNGSFCTCAVSNYTDVFSNVYHVDFVTSGTDVSLPAFDDWDGQAEADSAWGAVMPGSVGGYISTMIDSAAGIGIPINLVVRATLPAGYDSLSVANALDSMWFGSDEWDPNRSGGDLANTHQSVSQLHVNNVHIQSPDSFNTTGLYEPIVQKWQVGVHPNPMRDASTFVINGPPGHGSKFIEFYDLAGHFIRKQRVQGTFTQVKRNGFAQGLYIYRLVADGKPVYSGRMVVQ